MTVATRRQPGQGRMQSTVAVRYACPRCGGGEHPAAECGLEPGLSVRELRRLRVRVEHELSDAVRHAQPFGDLVELLTAVESRIARHDGEAAPSLEKRQRVYAERRV